MLSLEKILMSEIKEYKNNPRKNQDAIEPLVKSIKQCGYITPIIVDENNVIIAGHTRFKALQQLNYQEVNCLKLTEVSEEVKKKYRFLDNKTSEKAQWDLEKLEKELEEIDLQDFNFFGEFEKSEKVNSKNIIGSLEFETGDFDDEKFKYECPKCGYKFN